MNIFIGNLNFQTKEKELEELFSSFGTVTSLKIITDKFSGRSRGFAFAEMPDGIQAEKAINALNDFMLHDRMIRVTEAKPKEEN